MKMLKIIRIAAALTALITGCVSVSHSDNHADTTREIAPGVYSFAPGKGYHSMFVVTDDGVAAFETVNSEHATAMLEAIRTITDQPVKYALHSHNHWDYANGGGVMQQAGAQTVMHILAAKWLAANPGRDSSTPDMIWDGSRHDIKLGDVTIQLHYLGLNHGLGMTVFVTRNHRYGPQGNYRTRLI